MKHAIERAIEALEPLTPEDRLLAVRLAERSASPAAPAKKTKRKYTKRKALGEGIAAPVETAAEAAVTHPELLQQGGASAKLKAKKPGGLAALKSKSRARPLRTE